MQSWCPEATQEEMEAARRALSEGGRFSWWPHHASFTDVGVVRGLSFTPTAEDVIIATFVKSGTTWTTWLSHLIRGGDAEGVDEISAVVPEITALM